jgi:hypothetical protein
VAIRWYRERRGDIGIVRSTVRASIPRRGTDRQPTSKGHFVEVVNFI